MSIAFQTFMNPRPAESFDVAVIGFGPVGASLAALLGRRGHRVAVFDRSEEIYPLPRAFALDHEAMRTFQELGIADVLEPDLMRYRPTIYQGADGEPIQHFDMGPAPYALGWAPTYTFNQPALETSLRAAVAKLSNVSVYLGKEVTDAQEAGDVIELDVRTLDGDSTVIRSRFVVACDGGASPTRRRLGLKLKSLDFDEPWVVVDVRVDEDKLSGLPETNVQYCDPARPCTYVVGPGTHRRWEFLLKPEEAQQRELAPDAIWALLSPWVSANEAVIWRAATYRFHAVVLNEWRKGQTLFAGDSAHQMPPFLAQGMCQGLRDASNLAWKLDRVLRGQSPQALLDTYGEERMPQVEAVTATVKRLGKIICERDQSLGAERDRRLRAEQGGQIKVQLRQSLLPGIRHGLLINDMPPAGTPFPQPACVAGVTGTTRKMDDLVPNGFLLAVRDEPSSAHLASWQDDLDAVGVTVVSMAGKTNDLQVLGLEEVDGVVHHWFVQHNCCAALIRPDHIVYGAASDAVQIGHLLANARRSLGAG